MQKMPFSSTEYRERREHLRGKVRSGLILFLGNTTSPINYPGNAYRFRQDSNFLYYFGVDRPDFIGLMDLDGGKDILFGNDASMDDIIWMGTQPLVSELAEQVGVTCTRALGDAPEHITRALREGRKVHFLPPYRGEQVLALSEFLGLTPRAMASYASEELVRAVIDQRSIKRPCELVELEKAAEVGYEMHLEAMRSAQSGKWEYNLNGILEGIAVARGYQTSFSTILSQEGQTLHNELHDQMLSRGRLLLVDCGAESKSSHYASDNTRTIPVDGVYTEAQAQVYNTVLKGVELGMELSRPGIEYKKVHYAVCRVLTEGLKELGVMRGDTEEAVANGAHALFMPHGLGHMMGLDTHDMEGLGEDLVGYDEKTRREDQFGAGSLRCGRTLQPGFVVTVEPGIYFIPALIEKWKREKINHSFINFDALEPFYKFGGVRLEEDILITEEGCRIVGPKRIPIVLDEVCEVVKMGAS